ncbi:Heavy-metal-associated domain [Musa troglodytarum]|uniref:Heavy-metal-associated domain n=1 Tax=Musa troglodytarum TaxID=320322 RepID=A0A9E7I0T4_9LILI|nr:Heavy-metal-associated domain [Musa troglodytarum]URE40461.1 Heavy-metal-associated domain [Musa troglodytarum]
MKKIVLKVSIMCGKCKSCIMTTISKFHGVVSITMDAEKSTATVVGDVDAVLIVKALRKKKRPAEVVSVGEPDKEKKEEKKPEPSKPLPSCCTACKAVVVWYDEPNPSGHGDYLVCTNNTWGMDETHWSIQGQVNSQIPEF